jgi:hypothetical protein
MRDKGAHTPIQWWQSNPELGLAVGWAVICGVLWATAQLAGLI